jgi:hypothetical protein
MWTYIPDEEGKEAWTGQLTSPGGPKSLWRFELIRHADQTDLYRTNPFGDGRPVIGLLDLQERCTLIGPVVATIDPGSVGVHAVGLRTRILGEFQALLTRLPVSTDFDKSSSTHDVSIEKTQRADFDIDGIGRFGVTHGAQLSGKDRSKLVETVGILRIEFAKPASLNKLISISLAAERIFGFLIGFRGPLPVFRVSLQRTQSFGEYDIHPEGTLEIAGTDWQSKAPPTG